MWSKVQLCLKGVLPIVIMTTAACQRESARTIFSSTGSSSKTTTISQVPQGTVAAIKGGIVHSKERSKTGHYMLLTTTAAAPATVSKVRVLLVNQTGCTATTPPNITSSTYGWQYHHTWGFLRQNTIQTFLTDHQTWFTSSGWSAISGFLTALGLPQGPGLTTAAATTATTTTTMPNIHPNLACVAESIEMPYTSGQTITTSALNPATYMAIVSMEDRTDHIWARGTGSVTVVANGTQTVTITLNNNQTGASVGTVNVTVVGVGGASTTSQLAGVPTHLVFAPTTLTQNVNACGAIALNVTDANSLVTAATATETATLTSSSTGGAFYSDAGCTSSVTAAQIAVGASTVSFYYKDSTAGTATLTATDAAGLSLIAATATATIGSAAATQLVFSPSNLSQNINVCGALAINMEDASGNLATASSADSMTLASTSVGGHFYSDSACATAITSIQIAAGGSYAAIYYKDTNAGSPVLTATDASGLSLSPAGETAVISSSAAASQMVFAPTSLIQDVNICGTLTINLEDAANNLAALASAETATLASTSTGGHFYSDSACTTVITTVQIAIGNTSATVYYADSTAGAPVLTATDSASLGLSPAGESALINNYLLVFSGNVLTQDASTCGALTIVSQDSAGSAIAPSNAINITLATSATTGTFYADASCQEAITTVQEAANASSVTVYYKDTAAGTTPSLTAVEASGLGWNGASETAQIGVASTLAFTNAALSQAANACGTLTIQALSASNTAAHVIAATTIQLTSSNSTGLFYSDSGCTTAITTTTIAAAASSVTIYYKDSTVGAAVIGAVEAPAQGWMATSQIADIR